jgi:hypothetical protein
MDLNSAPPWWRPSRRNVQKKRRQVGLSHTEISRRLEGDLKARRIPMASTPSSR